MSNLRLPFDDESGSRRVAHRRARPRRARAGGRSALQRRARGVGGHRQDARAGRPLHQPAARRRRSREHPGDDVHAQGGGRDARAHPSTAARRPRRAARSRPARWRELRDRHRRHRHQHDRRVLPVAAARVPARGRPRPRLLDGRRHRGAAAGRRIARPRAAHLPRRWPARTSTWRWCSRSSATAARGRAWRALLDRRLVAPGVLARYLAARSARSDRRPRPRGVARRALRATSSPRCAAASTRFVDSGPAEPGVHAPRARAAAARSGAAAGRCRSIPASRPGGVRAAPASTS